MYNTNTHRRKWKIVKDIPLKKALGPDGLTAKLNIGFKTGCSLWLSNNFKTVEKGGQGLE